MTNTTDLTSDISLDLNLRMQHVLNNKNLNGSEDLSLGGIYGIKLYPDTELSAENGYIFGLEAKHKLPKINGVSNTLGVFYDAGRAFMSDASNNVTFEARVLQDVGIGLYTSYDNLFSRIQVAWKVGGKDVTSEPDRNSRILFQAGYVF
jgi:hemolysin activation/secretion protein